MALHPVHNFFVKQKGVSYAVAPTKITSICNTVNMFCNIFLFYDTIVSEYLSSIMDLYGIFQAIPQQQPMMYPAAQPVVMVPAAQVAQPAYYPVVPGNIHE